MHVNNILNMKFAVNV